MTTVADHLRGLRVNMTPAANDRTIFWIATLIRTLEWSNPIFVL
jgi:hypothetical protein